MLSDRRKNSMDLTLANGIRIMCITVFTSITDNPLLLYSRTNFDVVFTYVYPYLLVFTLFTRVYLCLPLFTPACLPMFTHFYLYLPMFTHVYSCLPMFTLVYLC